MEILKEFYRFFFKKDFNTWFYNCQYNFPKFKPLWWAHTPYMQCFLHQSQIGLPKIRWSSTYINLPDNVICKLDHIRPINKKGKGVIVVFHGLGGSSESSYCKVIANELQDYIVVIFNRRAHVEESASKRIPTYYDKDDFDYIMQYIKDMAGDLPIYGVGFSLGANLMVRYIGDTSDNCIFTKALACGNFWDYGPAIASLKSKYWHNMLSDFANDIYKNVENGEEFMKLDTLAKKDNLLIEKINYKGGINEYYKSFSAINVIDNINIPIICLDSLDDPLYVYPNLMELTEKNKNLSFIHTSHGGHTTWIDELWPRSAYYSKILKVFLEPL